MNYIVVPERRQCTVCDCMNDKDAKKCKGCGAVFCLGIAECAGVKFTTSFEAGYRALVDKYKNGKA